MTTTITTNSSKVFTITVKGLLSKQEYDRLQAASEQAMAEPGTLKLLIVTEEFAGWERHVDWSDLSFMMEHDEDIGKIAVVGEERWRDDLLMFLGAGLRSASVNFFTPNELQLAQAWLEAE